LRICLQFGEAVRFMVLRMPEVGIDLSIRKDAKRLLRVHAALVAAVLAGCAVGPDFRRPDPPAVSSYTADALPGETAEAKVAGGTPQRFVSGEEIPPLWWELFRSEALDRLIRQALTDSPTLSAAEARLREAEEIRRAQTGALYPRVDGDASVGYTAAWALGRLGAEAAPTLLAALDGPSAAEVGVALAHAGPVALEREG